MLKHKRLDHQFVRHMPDELSPGILYISMEYATASHLCCCGCGEEVVTPFAPAQWKMTFDGNAVSLHPSVGNWLLKCRSHYVVREGRVVDAGPWSDAEIAAGIAYDRVARTAMFEPAGRVQDDPPQVSSAPAAKKGVWARFVAWIKGVWA
jgi:hypothetical protein